MSLYHQKSSPHNTQQDEKDLQMSIRNLKTPRLRNLNNMLPVLSKTKKTHKITSNNSNAPCLANTQHKNFSAYDSSHPQRASTSNIPVSHPITNRPV